MVVHAAPVENLHGDRLAANTQNQYTDVTRVARIHETGNGMVRVVAIEIIRLLGLRMLGGMPQGCDDGAWYSIVCW